MPVQQPSLDPRVYGAYSKAPVSYKDPAYKELLSQAEQSVGIPQGMLAATVYAGERSNNNQVSPVGAKTMFQFMPKTRDYIKQKYGFDAYASPYEGAMAAASLLKENQQTLSKVTDDPRYAIAAYNTGAGNVLKHLTQGKPLMDETKGYLDRTSAYLGGKPLPEPTVAASTGKQSAKQTAPIQSVDTSSYASVLPDDISLDTAPTLLDTINAFSEGKQQADGVKQDPDTTLATMFHGSTGSNSGSPFGMLQSLQSLT